MTRARGSVMVTGTSSDAGKSILVTGICRWLHRQGVAVAPFKAQNMALNSFVTESGGEIGRAQAVQAIACGVEPEVGMNPVLLKPTGDASSQVVVMGKAAVELGAGDYQALKPFLLPEVLGALDDLRERFSVVVLEGAGSPAEINLADEDIVNLGLAARRDIPSILIGDIERGGVFASLYGTVELLPAERRSLVRAFVINKFRGDESLLTPGIAQLEDLTGLAHLGTLPHREGIELDAEDSLALARWGRDRPGSSRAGVDLFDVAVACLPRLSNITDVDPLRCEPSCRVRMVSSPSDLGRPDLVVIPGTKSTVRDLDWLRSSGMADAIMGAHRDGTVVLGICGGFQMLGVSIIDTVESRCGRAEGLGLLDVETVFEVGKVTARRRGRAGSWCLGTPEISGYEIHHGRVKSSSASLPFASLSDSEEGEDDEGAVAVNRRAFGTSLHGVFEEDGFRSAFLFALAEARAKSFSRSDVSYARIREDRIDVLADLVEGHLDQDLLWSIIGSAG